MGQFKRLSVFFVLSCFLAASASASHRCGNSLVKTLVLASLGVVSAVTVGRSQDAAPKGAADAAPAPATEAPILEAPPPRPFDPMPPEQIAAIDRGLDFLARTMHPSGYWDGSQHTTVATSLAGLAFLANGSTPIAGRYSRQVDRAINYLLANEARAGNGSFVGTSGADREIFPQGFAMVFLGQCLGMVQDPVKSQQLRAALQRGVNRVQNGQSADGGWYYNFGSSSSEGTTTILGVEALRSARDAGLSVNHTNVERAVEYIRRSQTADGGIAYGVGHSSPSYGISLAALRVFQMAGQYDDPSYLRILTYVRGQIQREVSAGSAPLDNYGGNKWTYGIIYLPRSMYMVGGEDWARLHPRLRADLLPKQNTNMSDPNRGSWNFNAIGIAADTANAIIALSMQNDYVPIFQR